MNDLIERIEAASGGSAELDAAIFWRDADKDVGLAMISGIPPYSTSIDAAMTLVPEGWMFGIERAGSYDGSPKDEAWCWPYESNFDPDWQNGQQGYRDAPDGARGFAATPALALCAAALKARAYLKETNNGD